MANHDLHITDDPAADELLSTDAFALLVGMLLDQQVAMETAFAGPLKIRERLGAFDPETIAATDLDELTAIFQRTPAVHRYPGSMAGRVQALAAAIWDEWGGDASAIWTRGEPSGADVLKRLKARPGLGTRRHASSWPCSASSAASKRRAGAKPPALTAKSSRSGRSLTS